MAGKHHNSTRQVGRKQIATPHHRHGHVAASRSTTPRTTEFRKMASPKARHETWAARKRQQKHDQKLTTSPVEALLLEEEQKPSLAILLDRLEKQMDTMMKQMSDSLLYWPTPMPYRYPWIKTYSSESDDPVESCSSDSIPDEWFDVEIDPLMDENCLVNP